MVKKLYLAALLSIAAAASFILMVTSMSESNPRTALIWACLLVICAVMAYNRYTDAIEIEEADRTRQLLHQARARHARKRILHALGEPDTVSVNPTSPTPANKE